MNKKASILDGIFILIMCLVFFLVFTTTKIVWDAMTADEALSGGGAQAQAVVNRYNTLTIPTFDRWFIFVFFGAYIGVFILAFFIRGTPAFLPIMITIIIIATVMAVFVSNAHDALLSGSALVTSTVADWPMTNFLMENLPFITAFLLIGLTVVMLALGETI